MRKNVEYSCTDLDTVYDNITYHIYNIIPHSGNFIFFYMLNYLFIVLQIEANL